MELKKLKCLKCGYEWYPSRPTKPKVCPRCKSYQWDKEYKNKEEKK